MSKGLKILRKRVGKVEIQASHHQAVAVKAAAVAIIAAVMIAAAKIAAKLNI